MTQMMEKTLYQAGICGSHWISQFAMLPFIHALAWTGNVVMENTSLTDFDSLFGMPLNQMRVLVAVSAFGAVLLFGYKLLRLVQLLQLDRQEQWQHNEKLIYAGLIVLLPLGLGAWVYDYNVRKKRLDPVYAILFLITVVPVVIAMAGILPHATQFGFDFLGW